MYVEYTNPRGPSLTLLNLFNLSDSSLRLFLFFLYFQWTVSVAWLVLKLEHVLLCGLPSKDHITKQIKNKKRSDFLFQAFMKWIISTLFVVWLPMYLATPHCLDIVWLENIQACTFCHRHLEFELFMSVCPTVSGKC